MRCVVSIRVAVSILDGVSFLGVVSFRVVASILGGVSFPGVVSIFAGGRAAWGWGLRRMRRVAPFRVAVSVPDGVSFISAASIGKGDCAAFDARSRFSGRGFGSRWGPVSQSRFVRGAAPHGVLGTAPREMCALPLACNSDPLGLRRIKNVVSQNFGPILRNIAPDDLRLVPFGFGFRLFLWPLGPKKFFFFGRTTRGAQPRPKFFEKFEISKKK